MSEVLRDHSEAATHPQPLDYVVALHQCRERGDYEAALALFDQCPDAKLTGDVARQMRFLLRRMAREQRRPVTQQLLLVLRRAVRARPEDEGLANALARHLRGVSSPESFPQEVLRSGTLHVPARCTLGRGLVAKGHLEEALELLRPTLELPTIIHYNLGPIAVLLKCAKRGSREARNLLALLILGLKGRQEDLSDHGRRKLRKIEEQLLRTTSPGYRTGSAAVEVIRRNPIDREARIVTGHPNHYVPPGPRRDRR